MRGALEKYECGNVKFITLLRRIMFEKAFCVARTFILNGSAGSQSPLPAEGSLTVCKADFRWPQKPPFGAFSGSALRASLRNGRGGSQF